MLNGTGGVPPGPRVMCLPNGWSAPTITADGTVFLGNEEGPFFALRDADGDGREPWLNGWAISWAWTEGRREIDGDKDTEPRNSLLHTWEARSGLP